MRFIFFTLLLSARAAILQSQVDAGPRFTLKTEPMTKKAIPFEFVLETLFEKHPITKPMFGAYGVYLEGGTKIVFILRDRDSYTDDNGVWIATKAEHHASLKKELPSMRAITIFGDGPTNWRCLPASAPDFEKCVGRACEMVLCNDERIGSYPKPKKIVKKKKPTK
ncbi:MAG: hypothetical protein ABIR96_00480 [Bdellovibrionota bacterium]